MYAYANERNRFVATVAALAILIAITIGAATWKLLS